MQGKRWISPVFGVLAVVIGLVVIGCGGGGSETASTSISKAEFLRRVNAACARSHKRVEAELATYLEDKELASAAAAASTQVEIAKTIVVPAREEEADEIRTLEAPSGDEAQVKAIVKTYEEASEKAKERPEQVTKNASAMFGKSEKLMNEYGLSDC